MRPDTARKVRIGVLAAVTLLVLYAGGRLTYAAGGLAEDACRNPAPVLPGWALVCISLIFFGAGRFATGLRADNDEPGIPPLSRAGKGGGLAAHAALATVFLFGVGALAYETVGVWPNPWKLQPITNYVRCATAADPLTTSLVAAVISFFVGHWLWFPARRRG